MKYLIASSCLFLLCNWGDYSFAQLPLKLSVQNSTLLSTHSIQPFWFTANQNGKVNPESSFLNITDLYIGQPYNEKALTGFSYTWGTNGIASFGGETQFQLNRAYAGIAWKGWELKGGTFYDSVRYAGLSTTNGNLARSMNARPVPTIRFSTLGYKKLPFAKKWLRFKGEYDEGLLNDERYVEGTHLHHKSLYGLIKITPVFDIIGGLEHYVMWGGTSPDYGELPGWEDYWRYVFGLHGDSDFIEGDQINRSGNQLGTYQVEFVKRFDKIHLSCLHEPPLGRQLGAEVL